ncbi:MAG: preprotein translocase subunit YajC [Treponema sp.]|nr:preprotein translocase subunit YajC [Treponema sp.]MCL2271905.1 preprotein translocase subunit YajC [Treponema sp.]
MNTFILPLLMAPPAGGAESAGAGGLLGSLVPFALIIGIFYFLIIRPQSKKRKETEKMLASIKKGDKIVTIGGVYGTVQNVKDTTVIIKVDDNVKIEFLRSAISNILSSKEEKIEEKEKSENEKSSDNAQTGE